LTIVIAQNDNKALVAVEHHEAIGTNNSVPMQYRRQYDEMNRKRITSDQQEQGNEMKKRKKNSFSSSLACVCMTTIGTALIKRHHAHICTDE
jgi:hypothetical protein